MTKLKPKKSLGQHFLTSKTIAQKIIQTGKITPQDKILEIGPGSGFLTSELLKTKAFILAIEKDNRAIALLKEKFSEEINNGQLVIKEEDILDFQPEKIREFKNGYKLIANIPYYLTGKIIRQFLNSQGPDLAVLLIQKEVADRITAKNKESILSLAIKIYGQAKKITTVKAGNFSPQPKVDSAILLIEKRDKALKIDEEKLLKIIKQGFEHKRKKLSANLQINPEILKKIGLNENIRAEDLKLGDWIQLSKII
ncbi:MAG TPA: ribosomal RNA small subunit methyltransferase A [Candidatus Vogelbacteria bacterium]|nr:ribosomal RNA small subunit methyltransferase A [Candidatus Vogelbacteria bacterium]